jgi:hypothetical protein
MSKLVADRVKVSVQFVEMLLYNAGEEVAVQVDAIEGYRVRNFLYPVTTTKGFTNRIKANSTLIAQNE